MTIIRETMLKDAGAEFSDCERYRYRLWRTWEPNAPHALFVMLNPSTATELVLDPTIRRCVAFAQRWGMGGIRIGNLFAFRSTQPINMWTQKDPVGPHNLMHIIVMARVTQVEKGICIAAWGADRKAAQQGWETRQAFRHAGIPLYALQRTKEGHPQHPLYVPGNVTLTLYEPAGQSIG